MSTNIDIMHASFLFRRRRRRAYLEILFLSFPRREKMSSYKFMYLLVLNKCAYFILRDKDIHLYVSILHVIFSEVEKFSEINSLPWR